ncbi:hypothetical protein KPH14_012975, partial [Odynerus spinipes]
YNFGIGLKSTVKKYVVAVFVDIQGAFDNLWWPAIRNRVVLVRSESVKIEKNMEKGCPQGSVIGPNAWNWCLDVLLNNLREVDESNIEVNAYADDILFLIKGNSRKEIENLAEQVIRYVEDWCCAHKLKVSETKTVAMLVKGKLTGRYPTIKMNGKSIKYADEIKYLGIMIDNKLNFISHVKYVRNKMA